MIRAYVEVSLMLVIAVQQAIGILRKLVGLSCEIPSCLPFSVWFEF